MQPLQQTVSEPTYLDFFGLKTSPFARLASPSQLFQAEQYGLLMEHLADATINADSLVVLCAADGSGKSTLLNSYLSRIGEGTSCVVINESCNDEVQFYTTFLTQIGFDEISGTLSELRNITKEFLVCRGIAGDHVVIMFDNAHLTDPRILEQLRWLCGIQVKDCRMLSVILAGNVDLVRVVDAPAMRSIKFRNHVVFGIRAYTEEETASYVWHRLRLAGGDAGIRIPQESYARIHRYSGGIPHLINELCHATLAEAHARQTRVIDERIVRIVADNQQLLPHVIPYHGKGRRRTDPDFQHLHAVPDLEYSETTAGSQTNESPESATQATQHPDLEPLLRQIARLSEHVEDLRVDKIRAIQDIEARNKDITKLREELDSQSKELASDLDNESRARRAAEDELATNTAELQREMDKGARRLDSMRRTLDSRNQEHAGLEKQLGESRKACELAELRIVELQSLKVASERVAQLDVLEKKSADLKVELERKTDDSNSLKTERDLLRDELDSRNQELAGLKIRLEEAQKKHELAELKQDLEATISDLEIELKTAKEHASEFDALEKKSADQIAELEGKTSELKLLQDELKRRNEIHADLEIRFEKSQSACELAQLRIVELKSPNEIEEIAKTSKELATDLETERRARESAEIELAEAATSIEELSQLAQESNATIGYLENELKVASERVAELDVIQKTSADLKVELERKTDDSNSLKTERELLLAELDSRNQELAGLEKQLEESRKACELAERRIVELQGPNELREMVSVADELAADLDKERSARESVEDELSESTEFVVELGQLNDELQEKVDSLQAEVEAGHKTADETKERQTRARETAEKDLAEAMATIDGLQQLQKELQATVRELNIDLKLADESAVEIYSLEQKITDLEGELGKNTRQLESRNQVIVELENRLSASQKERESVRGRAPAASVDAAKGSKAAARDKRIPLSGVAKRFEKSIRNIPAYSSLRDYDPDFYDGLVSRYETLVEQGLIGKQVDDVLRAEQAELMERLLPRASNGALLDYARLIIDQLDEFQLDGIEPCLKLLVPPSSPVKDPLPIFSKQYKRRELDLLEKTLRSYNSIRPLPAKEDVWPDLELIFAGLFRAFGADNVAAMQNSYDPFVDRVLVCNLSRALYSGILALPRGNAAKALRWLLSK